MARREKKGEENWRKQGKEIALPGKYVIRMMNEACAKKAQL